MQKNPPKYLTGIFWRNGLIVCFYTTQKYRFKAREGLIIEWTFNDLFHDAVTVILTSRMGVSEMVVNVGNIVNVIYGIIHSG